MLLSLASAASSCGGQSETAVHNEPPTCVKGFADCDGDATNGCETDLESSASCGRCDVACAAGTACTRGGCVPDAQIVNVHAGAAFTCVRRAGGAVACWGRNEHGQLATASSGDVLLPSLVSSLSDVAQLSLGGVSACARRFDGRVLCWGAPDSATLSTVDQPIPAPIAGLVDVARIATGSRKACALQRNGRVQCWGSNADGGLGDGGDAAGSPRLAAVRDLRDAVDLSVDAAACALRAQGTVSCWGPDLLAGDPQTSPLMRSIPSLAKAESVSVGPFQACSLVRGSPMCWGFSNGRPNRSPTLLRSGASDFVTLGIGVSLVCGLRRDGEVRCIESDHVDLAGSDALDTPIITGAVDLAVGSEHACALLANGELWCWGSNEFGQLGTGSHLSATRPVKVVP